MRTPENKKQTIRNEIKIIRARIKDNHKIYEKIDRLCGILWSDLESLEVIEERLKRDLREHE
jgi:hypothetical protein